MESEEYFDYQLLNELRNCFQNDKNWKGVVVVTARALDQSAKPREGVNCYDPQEGIDYYIRAQAFKSLGGTRNFKRCADAAKKAGKQKKGLSQCDLWDAAYLRLFCLYGYLNRSKTDSSGEKWDKPRDLEYEIKNDYFRLRNDLANKEGELSLEEQECAQRLAERLDKLKQEIKKFSQ